MKPDDSLEQYDGRQLSELSAEARAEVEHHDREGASVISKLRRLEEVEIPASILIISDETRPIRAKVVRIISDKVSIFTRAAYLNAFGLGGEPRSTFPIRAEEPGDLNEADVSADYFSPNLGVLKFEDPLTILDEGFEGHVGQKTLRPSTITLYRSHWRNFVRWCREQSSHPWYPLPFEPCPARDLTVGTYVGFLYNSGKSTQVIRQVISAIKFAHTRGNLTTPVGLITAQSINRLRPSQPKKRSSAKPITLEQLRHLIVWQPSSLKQARDNALVAITFAAALTRLEAQSLTRDQFEFTEQGVIYRPIAVMSLSKFANLPCYIPADSEIGEIAVSLLRTWLDIQSDVGPVFTKVDRFGQFHTKPLSRQAFQDIARRRLKMAGLPTSSYTFASLRRGFSDTCAAAGVERHVIRAHMRMRDDRIAGTINEPERGFANSPLHALKWPDSKEQ